MDSNLSRLYYILGNCNNSPTRVDNSSVIQTNSANEADKLLLNNANLEFPRSRNENQIGSGAAALSSTMSGNSNDGSTSLICDDDFDRISSLPLNVVVDHSEPSAATAATLDVTSNIIVKSNAPMIGFGGSPATHSRFGLSNYKVMFSKNSNSSNNSSSRQHFIRGERAGDDCHRRLSSSMLTSATSATSQPLPLSNSINTMNETSAYADNETVLVDIHFNPLYTVDGSAAQPLKLSSTPSTDQLRVQQQQQQLHLLSPPTDRHGLIYLALLLAGIGFLLPYNSFVIASDYFQRRFPSTTIVFDMSTTYIVVAFLTVIVSNLLVELIPLFWRLNLGYLLSLTIMIFVMLYEVCAQMGGYGENLVAIAIAAVGCTIQQSSFYGYTSMLPKKYTQAVMTGESAAGIFVSLSRIFTKILYPNDQQYNTALFFVISIVVICVCAVIHIVILPRSSFVRYHILLCNQKRSNEQSDGARIMHQINENLGLVNMYHSNNNPNTVLIDTSSINTDRSAPHLGDHYLSSARPSIYSALDASAEPATSTLPTANRSLNHKVQNILRTDSTEFVLPFGIDDEEIAAEQQQASSKPDSNLIDRSNAQTNANHRRAHHFSGESSESSNLGEFYTKNATSRMVQFLAWFENVTHSFRKIGLFFSQIRECDKSFSLLMASLRKKYYIRQMIISRVWTQIVSIILVYFVTLTIFPGIESEIYSCEFQSWMPIILMATFNLTDFIGKLMSTFFYRITGTQLLTVALFRFLLIPLLAFSVAPRSDPFFANPFWPILFSVILGLTNGIFGSLPMILAPIRVGESMREITGNLMTFSYVIGLTAGSFASYGLNYLVVGGGGVAGSGSDNLTYEYFLEQCSSASTYYSSVAPSDGLSPTFYPSLIDHFNFNMSSGVSGGSTSATPIPLSSTTTTTTLTTILSSAIFLNNLTSIPANTIASNISTVSTLQSFF